jgi:hypothetical protein
MEEYCVVMGEDGREVLVMGIEGEEGMGEGEDPDNES